MSQFHLYCQIVMLVVVSLFCPASWADDLQLGLVSHWPLDDATGSVVSDLAGENEGTVYDATWDSGTIDGCLTFNGMNSYVDCGNANSLNITSAITLTAWVKHATGSPGSWEDMVMKGADSYGFQFNGGSGEFTFHLTSGGWRNLASTVKPIAGVWYHVAGTFDGTTQKIYINGELNNETQWTGTINSNSSPLTMGYQVAGDNSYLNGSLDDVMVFNRALTSAEIKEVYLGGPFVSNIPMFLKGQVPILKDTNDVADYSFTLTLTGAGNTVPALTLTDTLLSGEYDLNTAEYPDGKYSLYIGVAQSGSTTVRSRTYDLYFVNQANVAIHEGTISDDETWSADVTHIVVGKLVIADGACVIIEPGAVVKFTTGASIWVAVDGCLTVNNATNDEVVFTSFSDDSAGGDTNMDGTLSSPSDGDWLGISGLGTISLSENNEIRYSQLAWYVKSGGSGDGKSWDSAFGSIQSAIDAAQEAGGGEVWVAAGIYTGTTGSVVTMKEGVAVYGGFAGNEKLRYLRNCRSNNSIIDGGSTYRCVVGASNAVLDGFIIQDGKADIGAGMYNESCSGLTVSNCAFSRNTASQGGGMCSSSCSSVTVSNCTFSQNTASGSFEGYGGGMCNASSSVTIINSIFTGNTSSSGGSGIYVWEGSYILTNCTFSENTDQSFNELFSGCVTNFRATLTATNSILWGNLTVSGTEITTVQGATTVTYSCIEGGYDGTENISTDPMFVETNTCDFRLRTGSPCINAGTATGAPGADILGNLRPQGSGYDMGAFEYTGKPSSTFVGKPICGVVPLTVAFADRSDAGTSSISSWLWDFGDGQTSAEQNPSHLYATVGEYTVSLAITTAQGSDTHTIDNYITAGNIVYVKSGGTGDGISWSSAYGSIQDAVNSEYAGEVWVAEGTYTDTSDPVLTMKTGLPIYGGFAGTETMRDSRNWNTNKTIIDGASMYRCVVGADGAALDGFTVQNGKADNGAGVYNVFCSPSIANCTFKVNMASQYGGGLYDAYSSLRVNNCDFSANTAVWGGGIYTTGSTPMIGNCTFIGNTASLVDPCYGGGIYNASTLTVTDSAFLSNTTIAPGSGWGCGGGIYSTASLIAIRCHFSKNTVSATNDDDNYGGGIYSASTLLATNCEFTGNTATNGGGVYNASSSTSLANCSFTGNTVSSGGGAVYSDSTVTATNCILWGDTLSDGTTASELNNAYSTVTYSCIDGGYSGTGNIATDPLFAGADMGELRLQSGSPCINTGTASSAPDTDMLDLSRPQGSGYDMGAYEYDGSPTAAFSASPTSGAYPLIVTFKDISDGGDSSITDWQWDFGDGVTSTAQNPSHMYNAGTYTVSLTVKTASGGNERIKRDYIQVSKATPTVSVWPTANAITYGQALSSSRLTGGAASVDGVFTFTTPSMVPSCLGTNLFAVTFTPTDSANYASVSGSVSVTVKPTASRFVASGATGTEDGSNWADAYTSIQEAVTAAAPGTEIWVMAGTYTGSSSPVMTMKSGVALYGGFSGTETTRDERDWHAHKCIIDGGSAYRCVVGASNAVLDGFIIQDGKADIGAGMYNESCSGLMVNNCIFSRNTASQGGGMCSSSCSSVTVSNCTFSQNTASGSFEGYGGGMCNASSSVTIINSIFTGNTSSSGGSGIYVWEGSYILTNCTFSENTDQSSYEFFSGCVSNFRATLTIANSILWGNLTVSGTEITTVQGATTVTYSCIEGGYDGTENISTDPMFHDAANGCFTLAAGSPCIDTGTSSCAPEVDILGIVRPQQFGYDMGAYEATGVHVLLTSTFLKGVVPILMDESDSADFTFTLRLTPVGFDAFALDLEKTALSGEYDLDTAMYDDGKYTLYLEVTKNGDAAALFFRTFTVYIINNANIVIHSGTIASNETWSANVVHVVSGPLFIASGACLTIEPGTIVKFDDGASILVEAGGTLIAEGVEGNPIVFTDISDDSVGGDTNMDGTLSLPAQGAWGGISGCGIITTNDYLDLRYIPVTHSGTLGKNTIWRGNKVHHITADIVVPSGVTLTILPGATLKFESGVLLAVESGGTLNAIGNNAQPIVFTSIKDDTYGGDSNGDGENSQPGNADWRGLTVQGTVTLSHVLMQYMANGSSSPAQGVLINGGGVTLSSCVLQHGAQDGIGVYPGTLEMKNCVLSDFVRGAWIAPGGTASITNCVIDDCSDAIHSHGGTTTLVNSSLTNYVERGIWHDLGGSISVRYSNVFSAVGVRYDGISDQTNTNGNISANPLYYNAGGGDYSLRVGSPLIDAADGTAAPETDHTDAPRYDDPHMPNTGTPTATGAYVDIGAFEAADDATSDMDLAVRWVKGPATARVGDNITIEYEVVNLGTKTVVGPWRDSIFLESADSAGARVELGEVLISQTLAPGASTACRGTFALSGAVPGNWLPGALINAHKDVFEGVYTANNRLVGDTAIAVSVIELSTDGGTQGSLGPNMQALYMLPTAVPGGTVIRIHGDSLPDDLQCYAGQGYAPTGSTNDYVAVRDQDGDWILYIPENGSGDPIYLGIETGATGTGDFTITVEPTSFVLYSIATTSGSSQGNVTTTIAGAGFSSDMHVELQGPKSLKHVKSNATIVQDAGHATVTFDLTGMEPGVYDVVATQGDSAMAVLSRAFTVLNNTAGARLEARLIMPDTVRAGREYISWIEYENVGNADMEAPLFTLNSETKTTVSLESDGPYQTEALHILGLNPFGLAGVLPPGFSNRIPVYFVPAGNSVHMELNAAHPSVAPIDWDACGADYVPVGLEDEVNGWWNNIRVGFGETQVDYLSNLAKMATIFCSDGMLVYDADSFCRMVLPDIGANGAAWKGYSLISEKNSLSNKSILGGVYDGGLANGALTLYLLNHVALYLWSNNRFDRLSGDLLPVSGLSGPFTIICHGRADGVETGEWISAMAGAIHSVDPSQVILAVDWHELADGGLFGLTGTALSPAASQGKFVYAVGEMAALKFSEVFPEFSRNQIHIIGHSFGSYVGAQMSQSLGNVKKLTTLDPAPITSATLVDPKFKNTATMAQFTDSYKSSMWCSHNYPQGKDSFLLSTVFFSAATLEIAAHLSACGWYTQTIVPESATAKYGYNWNEGSRNTEGLDKNARWFGFLSDLAEPTLSGWDLRRNQALYTNPDETVAAWRYNEVVPRGNVKIDEIRKSVVEANELRITSVEYPSSINRCEDFFLTVHVTNNYDGPRDAWGAGDSIQKFKFWAEAVVTGNGATYRLNNRRDDNQFYVPSGESTTDLELCRLADSVPPGQYTLKVKLREGAINGGADEDLYLENNSWEHEVTVTDANVTGDCPPPDDEPEEDYSFPPLPPNDIIDSDGSNIPYSCDPNELSGPIGFGDPDAQRYVVPGEVLHYTVYFENKADATASAQEIRVTNALSDALDWSTFRLGEVVLSNQAMTWLDGLASGSFEMQPADSTLKMRVEAGINVATGVVSWYLRAVDSSTSDGWPADPYAGILPPNDANHAGEGYVTYSVRVRSDATPETLYTGVSEAGVITAAATIVFDYNDAIITDPSWWNRITIATPDAVTEGNTPNGGYVSPDQSLLSWTGSGLAQTYNVYLWREGDPVPTTATATGVTSTFLQLMLTLLEGDVYHWRVDAVNLNGITTGQTWTFMVGTPNTIPVLDGIGDQSVNEGSLLTFVVSATDADTGDTLAYSAENLPAGAAFDPATRMFTWTPGYFDADAYTGVTFTVTDDGVPPQSASETITITVNNVNRGPGFTPIGNHSVEEGATLSFTVFGSDPDGDLLTYSATGLPPGAAFDPAAHIFTWTPGYVASGTYPGITFTVADNGVPQLSASETITITVNNVNRSPGVTPIENHSVDEGVTLSFTVFGSDPDGDSLTYSASGLPSGASFDPATHVFTWTPDYAASGTYPGVTFTVADNGVPQLIALETITITVNNVNRSPILDPIGNKSVKEGESLSFSISATDADGDALVYNVANLPSGASFDTATRQFSWTPAFGTTGNYPNVTFTVTDNGEPAQIASESITISVGDVNRPPELGTIGDRTIDEGNTLTIILSATDPDDDTLTYTASNLPAGASFDPATHTFTWTPGTSAVGTHAGVTFSVTDSGTPPLSDSESITITVSAATAEGETEGETEGEGEGELEGETEGETGMTIVPNLVGLTREEAVAALLQVGLALGTMTEVNSDTMVAGLIVTQDPGAGAQAVAGGTVNVSVSVGPANSGCGCLGGKKGSWSPSSLKDRFGDLFMLFAGAMLLIVLRPNFRP